MPAVALAMVGAGIFSEGAVAVALIVVGAGTFFIGTLEPTLSEFKIGPSGFSAKLRERDLEVKAAIEPESERLLRTATLLAGSPEAGRELLDRALVETYLRWQQAKQEGPADAVHRLMVDLVPAPEPTSSAAPGGAP